MAKTSTERSNSRDKRLRDKGLKQLRNLWAYGADEAAIREFAHQRTTKRKKLVAVLEPPNVEANRPPTARGTT